MSRVGKNLILVPSGVSIVQSDGFVEISGPKGKKEIKILPGCSVEIHDKNVSVKPANKSKDRAMWGTMARLIQSTMHGVDKGVSLSLDLVGVGYRASVSGDKIQLQLGFSHDVTFMLPSGVQAKADKPTTITLHGICRQKIGQVAANIRSFRPPEPYKGKGVIRANEFVLRKEGKKK